MRYLGLFFAVIARCVYRKSYNFNCIQAVLFIAAEAVVGLIGSKSLFVAHNGLAVLRNGLMGGGWNSFGSFFLILLVMPIVGKCFGLRPAITLDACAAPYMIMYAFQKIGCFLTGCCGGTTASFWGFDFAWPTQLMESLYVMILFVILIHMEEKGAHKGVLYPIMLFAFALERFLVEFLRKKESLGLFGLSLNQTYAIAIIVVLTIFFVVYKKKFHDA